MLHGNRGFLQSTEDLKFITTSSFITENYLIKAAKTFSYKRIKRIMVTVQQKLGLATKKLKKPTRDSKTFCDDETKKTMKKIKQQKANWNCIFKDSVVLYNNFCVLIIPK